MARTRTARSRPRVMTRCVANSYAATNERIVEFAGPDGENGGLISFRLVDGVMVVETYRCGSKVVVNGHEQFPTENPNQ